ncbi:Bug family tripartite tricarboxylate transporter substrate binding protein [Humitalea sp. 24SJ18S-53]|uniref:Bug family tripartite tricarboxylate transporter substrate binding protein n=1 Tax=Humitalea sp. 24SJ18S-53 TaxID=3422307 RepID=UPI003D668300
MFSRRQMAGAVLGSATLATPALAQAGWPHARPIEMIVPYPPAGGIDIMGRLVAKHLPNHLPGARFVVNNRVGAGGQMGGEAIFAARPDGYTLGAVATLSFATRLLDRPARWSTERFTYIAQVVDDAGAFWVKKDSPLQNLADLQAACRRGAESVSVGCAAGIGSDDHILLLAFEQKAGVRALNAPYNGTAIVIRDLLGGTIDVASYNNSEGVALLRQGTTRCLGSASAERWSAMSDVPTFREQGFDVIGGSARGFVAPPDLPPEIAQPLVAAFRTMLADPSFTEEATRLTLPLSILYADEYRQSVLREAELVQQLYRERPWSNN